MPEWPAVMESAVSFAPQEYARFSRVSDIAPLELLDAFYTRQQFAPHFHEEYVVNTLRLGAQSYQYRGSSHIAGIGALILINPGEVHTGKSAHEQGWAYHGFYPSQAFMLQLAAELHGRPVQPYFRQTVVYDPELAARLQQLFVLLQHSRDLLQRESAQYAVFADVLRRHMAVREILPGGADDGVLLERVRQMLADRIHENLSLHELGELVGLSPWHLNRRFRQQYGLPPVAWRNQLRIARARGLLAAGQSASQVASQLGFADQSHLSRSFRQTVGVPPVAYQRALQLL